MSKEGEFISIMGPSGAGKSTLLHIIGMHDSAWTGEYYFLDQPVHKLGAKDRAKLHKQYIGFVFQSYHLLDHLTVYENLDIPLSYRDIKKSERESMVCDILDKFAIVGKKDLYPNQLSGGQQQLVAVARAVISNPKVILADEPTGNLHSSQGKEIMELFKKLNERRHDDHPGDALGSQRRLRQPRRQSARRLGGGRVGGSGECERAGELTKGRRHDAGPFLYLHSRLVRSYQRGSFRRPPLKSPSSKLRPPPPPTAAAIAAAAAAATAATEAAFRLRARFVDDERPAFHLLLVEFADGFLRFLVRAHLDEREAASATSRHVAHHADAVDLARAAEQFGELIFGRGVRKVPDVESPAHAVTYSCPRQPDRPQPQLRRFAGALVLRRWLRYKMTRDCSDK